MNRDGCLSVADAGKADDVVPAGDGNDGESTIMGGIPERTGTGEGREGGTRSGGREVGVGALMGVAGPVRTGGATLACGSATTALTGESDE
jgi:hypothetical protein